MLPDIVTFWHGPMDALRQTCLRSQLAAGHKVTVYSFDTIRGLPAGVGNADAEAGRQLARLDHASVQRLLPHEADGEGPRPVARRRRAAAEAGRDRSRK